MNAGDEKKAFEEKLIETWENFWLLASISCSLVALASILGFPTVILIFKALGFNQNLTLCVWIPDTYKVAFAIFLGLIMGPAMSYFSKWWKESILRR